MTTLSMKRLHVPRVLKVVTLFLLLLPAPLRAQVLFLDDFSTSPRLAPIGFGSWRVINGVLRSDQPAASETWLALGDPSWLDYQVEFDLRFPTDFGRLYLATHVNDGSVVGSPGMPATGILVAIDAGYPGRPYFGVTAGPACQDIQGVLTNPDYQPGWHHIIATVSSAALLLQIDGVPTIDFHGISCLPSPAFFVFGNIGPGGPIEVDNMTVQAGQPVITRAQSWGHIKADRR